MNLDITPEVAAAILELAKTYREPPAASPDINIPERPALASHIQSPVPPAESPTLQQTSQQQSFAEVQEKAAQGLAREHTGKSPDEIRKVLPGTLGERVIEIVLSQAPTVQQAFGRHQRAVRAAKAEFGKDLTAAGVELKHHSEKDFTHVIVTQLDMLQTGVVPSVSAVVNAAFPDDPKKATSIKNSQHGKRRRKAWHSPAVMNHPMEKAMQQTHGKDSMNRRHSARTFGQSLGMNATLFKSCDRITKLEARVQLLEQQMRETKNREALDDAGCTTSREKVLILSSEGKGPKEIATLLGIPYETVRTIRRRSKQ